jgi:MFS family permease
MIRRDFMWGRRVDMRKTFAGLICFFVLLAALSPGAMAQTRRYHHSHFGRKARTAAAVAGGAAVGGLIGGRKGAAIGAGGAGLYAFNRPAARRHFRGRTRTAGSALSGAALGAGVGGAVGHGRGAAAGAILGAGGGYLYRRHKHTLPRRY